MGIISLIIWCFIRRRIGLLGYWIGSCVLWGVRCVSYRLTWSSPCFRLCLGLVCERTVVLMIFPLARRPRKYDLPILDRPPHPPRTNPHLRPRPPRVLTHPRLQERTTRPGSDLTRGAGEGVLQVDWAAVPDCGDGVREELDVVQGEFSFFHVEPCGPSVISVHRVAHRASQLAIISQGIAARYARRQASSEKAFIHPIMFPIVGMLARKVLEDEGIEVRPKNGALEGKTKL